MAKFDLTKAFVKLLDVTGRPLFSQAIVYVRDIEYVLVYMVPDTVAEWDMENERSIYDQSEAIMAIIQQNIATATKCYGFHYCDKRLGICDEATAFDDRYFTSVAIEEQRIRHEAECEICRKSRLNVVNIHNNQG